MNTRVESKRSQNIAHVATYRGQLSALCVRHGCELHEEPDDLGDLWRADFFLPGGLVFRLLTYRGMNENTFELFFESQLPNWQERLKEITNTLAMSPEDILWINDRYFDTP
jgi:hypothetical protein